ncbi:hypothetical protein L3Q82_015399, partial [Scortum barcoo]
NQLSSSLVLKRIMNLPFSRLLVVVGLFLSSSALTPEECQPLLTPLSLDDPSVMYNRSNFIAGYTNNDIYNGILKVTQSSWLKLTPTSNSKVVVMSQENMINGACFASAVNVTIDGNTATTSIGNISSSLHLLPSCEGCLLFSIESTVRDLDKVLQFMKLNSTVIVEEHNVRALYLMARESMVKDSDLEHFKQQASCLGFSGEPDFHYDPKNGNTPVRPNQETNMIF